MARPGRPFPNIIIRINMRAVLQLLVLMVVVYQHCPPGRFFMLLGLGLLLYLTATEPVRRFLNRLAGVQRAAPAGPPQPQQQPQQQPQGHEAAGWPASSLLPPLLAMQSSRSPMAQPLQRRLPVACVRCLQRAWSSAAGCCGSCRRWCSDSSPPSSQVRRRDARLHCLTPTVFLLLPPLLPTTRWPASLALPPTSPLWCAAGWNVNPDDAAAIAAAQQMFAEDDEAAQQAGIR
jgi:hypothetical protein